MGTMTLKEKKSLLRKIAREWKNEDFYVYKLTVKESGLFYIGVTLKPMARELQHYGGIRAAMRGIVDKTSEKGKLPFHLILAHEFLKDCEVPVNYKRLPSWMVFDHLFFRGKCDFKILRIKKTKEEAAEVERLLLSKHKDNPKFLNILNHSNYDSRKYREERR